MTIMQAVMGSTGMPFGNRLKLFIKSNLQEPLHPIANQDTVWQIVINSVAGACKELYTAQA